MSPCGLSVQQCWRCFNFSTARNCFPPLCVLECQHAPLCFTHHTPTHTCLIPTRMLFYLRKFSTCLICGCSSWALHGDPRVPSQLWAHLPRLFSDLPSPFMSWRTVRILSTQADIIKLISHIAQQPLSSNMKRTALYSHGMRMAPEVAEWNQAKQPDRNESVSVTSNHHVKTDQTKILSPRAHKRNRSRGPIKTNWIKNQNVRRWMVPFVLFPTLVFFPLQMRTYFHGNMGLKTWTLTYASLS